MKYYYLIVDGELSGTGIRDKYEGPIELDDLELSLETKNRIEEWVLKYAEIIYNGGYKNLDLFNDLDQEGKEIALTVKSELGDVKMEYYSDARLTLVTI